MVTILHFWQVVESQMASEKQFYGLTAEAYRAIMALIDDRMAEVRVVREDFDRLTATVRALAEAQRRTEERVNELAEAQRRTEERLERLEAIVEVLAEAQRRTEERLERLEAIVEALAEAQRRTEERVNELAEAQRRTEERVNELAEAQRRTEEQVRALAREMFMVKTDIKGLKDDMGSVKGRLLEMDYREKASSYFGRLLRRVRVLPLVEWLDELEAHLSPEEVDEVWRLDLVVGGVLKEGPEVWLAVEVSSVMDRNDVERAARRAELLRRLGRPVVAVVAGEEATEGGVEAAQSHRVALFQDGRPRFWPEALEAALRGAVPASSTIDNVREEA